MARNIFVVNATQVVTSAQHPEGVQSVIDGYPKPYDSRSYNATQQNPNGDSDVALICAQADFTDRIKTLTLANTPSRVQWAVTITREDGQQIARKAWGAMPDMTPEPEPNEEPEEE